MKRYRKGVSGQSVSRESEEKEEMPRPQVRVDATRNMMAQSDEVDFDAIRIQVNSPPFVDF